MENDVIYIDVSKTLLTSDGVVDLSIQTSILKGTITALYGPSGVGKTTFIKMIAGLIAPDRGKICFGSKILYDSTSKIDIHPQKRSIGLMFQDYALFPNMTVEENIRYAQPEHDKEEIDKLIDTFGLSEHRKIKPQLLSGGQKQRVALARALASHPQVLLLDEPLSAVDSTMRTHLQDMIIRTKEISNITIILVSHDLSEVFRIADRVLCLKNGKIDRDGSPNDVFMNTDISNKVQIVGKLVSIEKSEIYNLLTIVTGNNQIIKTMAFENDMCNLAIGDEVMISSKAFNPLIKKVI